MHVVGGARVKTIPVYSPLVSWNQIASSFVPPVFRMIGPSGSSDLTPSRYAASAGLRNIERGRDRRTVRTFFSLAIFFWRFVRNRLTAFAISSPIKLWLVRIVAMTLDCGGAMPIGLALRRTGFIYEFLYQPSEFGRCCMSAQNLMVADARPS